MAGVTQGLSECLNFTNLGGNIRSIACTSCDVKDVARSSTVAVGPSSLNQSWLVALVYRCRDNCVRQTFNLSLYNYVALMHVVHVHGVLTFDTRVVLGKDKQWFVSVCYSLLCSTNLLYCLTRYVHICNYRDRS